MGLRVDVRAGLGELARARGEPSQFAPSLIFLDQA